MSSQNPIPVFKALLTKHVVVVAQQRTKKINTLPNLQSSSSSHITFDNTTNISNCEGVNFVEELWNAVQYRSSDDEDNDLEKDDNYFRAFPYDLMKYMKLLQRKQQYVLIQGNHNIVYEKPIYHQVELQKKWIQNNVISYNMRSPKVYSQLCIDNLMNSEIYIVEQVYYWVFVFNKKIYLINQENQLLSAKLYLEQGLKPVFILIDKDVGQIAAAKIACNYLYQYQALEAHNQFDFIDPLWVQNGTWSLCLDNLIKKLLELVKKHMIIHSLIPITKDTYMRSERIYKFCVFEIYQFCYSNNLAKLWGYM
ncbi:24118_t:CDS:2 [Gigaspora margarita]|uniref:24118_t:CDS:1 n=1 Tax=Gigaspora margarita TaxID=4874 RepID=A0ABN7VI25_GIGMA|nr:24118_t:CDS:2 [Gigaspora margarita]